LLTLLTVISLVACKPGSPAEPETTTGGSVETTPGESTTEAVTEKDPLDFPEEDPDREIVFYEDGKWLFKVVRPDEMNFTVERTLATFRYKLSTVTNVGIGISSDYLESGEAYVDDACEILYGNTGHLQSISKYSETCLGESGVYVVGNKIVICAYTETGFAKCYNHLTSILTEGYADGKVSAKVSDITKVFNVSETLSDIPRPDRLRYYWAEECQNGQYIYMFKGATEQDFIEYQDKFYGYTKAHEKAEAGNRFATYQIGNSLVNISYSKYDNRIRTIINEDTAPSALLSESAATSGNNELLLIMHGLGWGTSSDDILNHQNGICIIFKLADGRFMVVDGGFNRQGDADDLYNLLARYTPAGTKPTVAAWFITHAHGDHHSTFASKFVKSYGSRVKIENVLFNPPSVRSDKTSSNEKTGEDLIISVTRSISGCNWIRPHVGDRYYIGDAVVDFYYTIDQYYPQTFTYYNTCSLMFSVTLGGQKIMINGDAANASFREAIKMFGESLNSDIVQVAHHGYGTGVADALSTDVMQGYRYMSPSLVLWPLGNEHYDNLSKKVYNKYLVALPSVKEIVVAGKDNHVFKLPYTPKES